MISEVEVLERYKDLAQIEAPAVEEVRAQYADLSSNLPCLASRNRLLSGRGRVTAPRPSLDAIAKIYQQIRYINPEFVQDNRFGNIVSQILDIADVTIEAEPIIGDLAPINVNSCSAAEVYFSKTIDQISSDAAQEKPRFSAGLYGITVMHTAEGDPLLLRKSYEAINALSLIPIRIGEITIPKGSIIGVLPPDIDQKSGSRVIPATNNGYDENMIYTTYEVDTLSIAPSRITPWAYDDPADRALFGCGQDVYDMSIIDASRADKVSSISLEDFRHAAQSVLTMCGV